MKIAAYNPTAEATRLEWTGTERRAPVAFVAPTARIVKRDHFALIALAVFVAVGVLALVVL